MRTAIRLIAGGLLVVLACQSSGSDASPSAQASSARTAIASPVIRTLVTAALGQIGQTVHYDPAYVALPYPGGDVPLDRGVCTDVVIRAFRSIGLDLQRAIHEDIQKKPAAYARRVKRIDRNIDHRRVPNQMVYFARQGAALPVTQNPADYLPGDVVTWDMYGRDHTGVVSNVQSSVDARRHLIVHNVGRGTELEDILFAWKITGHYRWRR